MQKITFLKKHQRFLGFDLKREGNKEATEDSVCLRKVRVLPKICLLSKTYKKHTCIRLECDDSESPGSP